MTRAQDGPRGRNPNNLGFDRPLNPLGPAVAEGAEGQDDEENHDEGSQADVHDELLLKTPGLVVAGICSKHTPEKQNMCQFS
jgi:hypothetical protein